MNKPKDVERQEVLSLAGHEKEVFACSWNPVSGSLATGSGDGSARVWPVPATLPAGSTPDSMAVMTSSTVLDHASSSATAVSTRAPPDSGRDVTCVAWSNDGETLATAGQDGVVRLWGQDGTLKKLLEGHTGSVFSLEWAPSDKVLLTGAEDSVAIVWDAATGAALTRFTGHSAPVLDVCWKSDTTFATAGTDHVVKVGTLATAGGSCEVEVVATFAGHSNEINALAWSSDGRLLASASDDTTAKVWDVEAAQQQPESSAPADAAAAGEGSQTGPQPLHSLTAHTGQVYSLAWAPAAARDSVGSIMRLATGSQDNTVRLWDTESGACLATLAAHAGVVYSVQYSPDGLLLASGGFDKAVHVWDAKEGTIVRSFIAEGGVYSVQWRPDCIRLAAALSDGSAAVFDVRE